MNRDMCPLSNICNVLCTIGDEWNYEECDEYQFLKKELDDDLW